VSINEPINLFDDITYIVSGLPQLVEHKDIIHLLNYSNDGIRGVSTIYYANQSLDIATESELAANQNLNSNVTGLLSVETALSVDQIKQAKKAWNQNVAGNSGGGIAVLSGGWKFQPLNLSSTDLQLIESREFNSIDVARWFGVPGSKLGINKSVSYNSIEAEQLAFLSDTLHPLLQKIECELERKLYTNAEREYIDVRFDIKPILRIDQKSQSEYFRTLFNMGVMTINEIRNELDLQKIEGGDNVLMQTNMSTLNNIIQTTKNDDDKQQ
jgi:HK97 family phage portal protein